MSDPHEPEPGSLVDEVVDPRLFLVVVSIAAVSVTADYLGVGVLGVETVADAIETVLVMTVGSYVGVVVIDVAWNRLLWS
ncbi:hypothetical protein [Haloarchaeobius sp. FL176]|uniref:hypothetical protein n=1 Tax=Haloarchaeobius sp. FL176 TaxID=2967129 RepID=UPI002147D2D4|nr:hypothetical protein [Haloarchaeobius sp. FL176]